RRARREPSSRPARPGGAARLSPVRAASARAPRCRPARAGGCPRHWAWGRARRDWRWDGRGSNRSARGSSNCRRAHGCSRGAGSSRAALAPGLRFAPAEPTGRARPRPAARPAPRSGWKQADNGTWSPPWGMNPLSQQTPYRALLAGAHRLGEPPIAFGDLVELFLVQVLDIDEFFAGALQGHEQFIELDVQRAAVLVLVLLDQEHHQEGDDGGSGVDHQLPHF